MAAITQETVYARLSLLRPRAGQRDRALSILDDLIEYYALKPGYLDAYTLSSPAEDGRDEIGRLTLWESDRDTDRVATSEHVLALRAQLQHCAEDGSDVERAFWAKSGPLAAAFGL